MAKGKKTKTKRKRPIPKKMKTEMHERLFFVIATLVVISAIILSVSPGNLVGLMQEEQTRTPEIGATYSCKRNTECFLASCKDTPSVVECVNAVVQETYGTDNCGSYVNVNVVQDLTKCICVEGLCKLIR